MNFLLHASGGESGDVWHGIYEEVLLGGLLDTLKIIPFLFLTYLFMEFIEHKASGKISAGAILAILAYKAAVGIFVGFAIDLTLKLMNRKKDPINIDEICDEDNCHCERGILFSALHHTVSIGAFVLVITLGVNALVYFIGAENIAKIMYDKPFISHLIAAVIGLIPNCAVSVALTNLAIGNLITVGTMMSGLFSGAGVGLLILFKINKNLKQNLTVVGILVASGVIFGLFADLLNFSALL